MNIPDWMEAELFEFQIAHGRGDHIVLFEAIRACGQYGIPLPDWVRQELQKGLDRYKSAESWEFGEAFGIVRRKGAWPNAERAQREKAWPVYCAVVETMKGNDKYPSESVRGAIGDEFGISASQVGKYFELVRDYLRAHPTD